MDLRDIEYFAVLAQQGHMGRAAEALGLGQPALSMSLRRLEKSAGAKLVKRTPKGVELTPIGAALLSHVSRLRLARDDLAREISDLAHGRGGHLRIGASPANSEALLPEACAELVRVAPDITFNIQSLDNEALVPAVLKGEIDLAVWHTRQFGHPDIVEEVLQPDEFVVYCAHTHRLAGRKSLSLADIAPERWVSTEASAYAPWRSLRQIFAEHDLPPPRIAIVTASVTLKLKVVAATDLLGIGTKRSIANGRFPQLKVLPLKLDWIRPIAVAYRKDGYLSPSARQLIETLKSVAKRRD